jgi:hypothetical protein
VFIIKSIYPFFQVLICLQPGQIKGSNDVPFECLKEGSFPKQISLINCTLCDPKNENPAADEETQTQLPDSVYKMRGAEKKSKKIKTKKFRESNKKGDDNVEQQPQDASITHSWKFVIILGFLLGVVGNAGVFYLWFYLRHRQRINRQTVMRRPTAIRLPTTLEIETQTEEVSQQSRTPELPAYDVPKPPVRIAPSPQTQKQQKTSVKYSRFEEIPMIELGKQKATLSISNASLSEARRNLKIVEKPPISIAHSSRVRSSSISSTRV